ncbi:MAG: hypothetical protein F6J97_22700 [Leptolyngbya sp. SIO4C1]|nr:hypothetical protein [Leptolyngbya sp. SIO4C1]
MTSTNIKGQQGHQFSFSLERWAGRLGWTKRGLLRNLMIAYGIILAAAWAGVLAKEDVKPSFKYATVLLSVGFWGAYEGCGQSYQIDRKRAIDAIEAAIGPVVEN